MNISGLIKTLSKKTTLRTVETSWLRLQTHFPLSSTRRRGCREIKEAHDLIESGERSPCVTPSEASWILSDIRRMGGLTTRKELLDLVDPDRPPLIANPIPSDEHDGVVLHFGLLSEDMQRNRFAEDVMIVMVVDPITFEITLRPTRFLMHVNPLDFPPLLPIDWGFRHRWAHCPHAAPAWESRRHASSPRPL